MVSLEHAQLLMPDVSENISIAVSNFIVIYLKNNAITKGKYSSMLPLPVKE